MNESNRHSAGSGAASRGGRQAAGASQAGASQAGTAADSPAPARPASLGDRIAEARRQSGQTQAEVAQRFGISAQAVSQWEAGRAKPDVERLEELARLLGVDFIWLCFGAAEEAGAAAETGAAAAPPGAPPDAEGNSAAVPTAGPRGRGRAGLGRRPGSGPEAAVPTLAGWAAPRDLPVLGIAVGGSDAGFEFNGQTVDYVARPPALAGTAQAFALYVTSDSMAPRYEAGELVFVHPSRPPQPGCDVVIEMLGEDGAPGRCYIKRLRRRTAEAVIAEQFNPPRSDLRYPVKKLRRVMRILTTAELFGG
ncbi:XRE family transcriptional regulator [Marinibaculum pumilum]|uniref:XRE family transcriptional regulator n=1 Tax=Marinibaculum pumilum TaxID=1766165 RepID=A0ABV7L9H6_9PROT